MVKRAESLDGKIELISLTLHVIVSASVKDSTMFFAILTQLPLVVQKHQFHGLMEGRWKI